MGGILILQRPTPKIPCTQGSTEPLLNFEGRLDLNQFELCEHILSRLLTYLFHPFWDDPSTKLSVVQSRSGMKDLYYTDFSGLALLGTAWHCLTLLGTAWRCGWPWMTVGWPWMTAAVCGCLSTLQGFAAVDPVEGRGQPGRNQWDRGSNGAHHGHTTKKLLHDWGKMRRNWRVCCWSTIPQSQYEWSM